MVVLILEQNKARGILHHLSIDTDHRVYVHARGRYGGVQTQAEEKSGGEAEKGRSGEAQKEEEQGSDVYY